MKLYKFENFNPEEEWVEDELEYRFRLTIGDWSDDGHGQSDELVFVANYPVSELRQAYKDSCKKTGIQFNNNNKNYTGSPLEFRDRSRMVCVSYEDYTIHDNVKKILINHGIDMTKYDDYLDPDSFGELIMEFIRISLPDLKWEESSYKRSELKNITPLNGWWNKELNHQFGYGLYE